MVEPEIDEGLLLKKRKKSSTIKETTKMDEEDENDENNENNENNEN